jgi:plastocyanin
VKFRLVLGATLAALALAGCGSSADDDAIPSPTASDGSAILPPVIVTEDQSEATAKVGDTIVFNVADPVNNEVTATPPGILEITQGSDDGMALFNPGAKAIAVGDATVLITDGDSERTVLVKVTE